MQGLYETEIKCPICNHEYQMTKVLTRRARVVKRDEDFCPYYKDLNPIFYSVSVCPNCGYTSFDSTRDDLTLNQKELYRMNVMPKWQSKDLNKNRDLADAIKTYKLLLLTYKMINAKESKIAKACLRLAWLYRYKKDEDKEKRYLKQMIKHNELAFENEDLSDAGRQELEIMYILGETYRKFGELRKAINWFSKVSNHENINANRVIKIKNRDQWSMATQEFREGKENV
jgi:uncharacterized protein (DUF2225 family)